MEKERFKKDVEGYVTILTKTDIRRCYYLMFFSSLLLITYYTGLTEYINFLDDLNPIRRLLTFLGRCDIIDC